jgi:membrane protein implicated in regulation of membrane protease activity
MENYSYWFLLALTLLGVEMATGTFYLLVLSVATTVGGVAAWSGMATVWQLTLCAIGAMVGIILLRFWKSTQVKVDSSGSMDIGQQVKVLNWHEDGSARVMYRGAEWDAQMESPDVPRSGILYIAALRGATLVLTHRKLQS